MKARPRSCRTTAGESGGHRTCVLTLVVALMGVACGGDDTAMPSPPSSFNVVSESFDENGTMPERFTCDGQNVAPSLGWENRGPSASYAITMTDVDAGDFVHWLVLGIPGDVANFPAGSLPSVASEGMNDFGSTGYRGPCPPTDEAVHRYVFTVYGLDKPPAFFAGTADENFTLDAMLDAIRCCVVSKGTTTVRYGR